MIKFWLFIFGTLLSIVGLITTRIAKRFNPFNITPFSKFCYEFEEVFIILFTIGVTMVSTIGLINFFN